MSDVKGGLVAFIVIVCLVVGGVFGALVFPREIEKDCPEVNQTDCPECPGANETDCPECPECKTSEEIEKEAIMAEGYLIDGFSLGQLFYWDKYGKLSLFDGEVEFDGDDYDAEERFILTGFMLKADITDFEGNDYLTMETNSFEYLFKLKSKLNISLIDSEDTLEIELLGKEVEISNWENSEITFTEGKEYSLSKGESIVVNGKNITLEFVLENDAAYVTVDEDSKKIVEGDIAKFNGIEIKAKEVLFSGYAGGYEKATLIIGTNIETTVEHGEEYEEDSIWNWIVTGDSIGLTLNRDLNEREDDGFDALAPGEIICLPNNYICTLYDGLYEEVEEEYEFDLDNTGNFVVIEGEGNSELLIDNEEVDKVYIKIVDGTVYSDKGITEIDLTSTDINFGYTDIILEVNMTHININDFWVTINLDDTIAGCGEIDYRTNYGIFVEDIDDVCDGDKFTIIIPEEKLEGKIIVKQGGFEEIEKEPVCDIDNLELCLDETTCTDAEGYWYGDVCNVEEASSE